MDSLCQNISPIDFSITVTLLERHLLNLTLMENVLCFLEILGELDDYLLKDPKTPEWADFLFIESTYGNKLHPEEDVEGILSTMIKDTIHKKGNLNYSKFCSRTTYKP